MEAGNGFIPIGSTVGLTRELLRAVRHCKIVYQSALYCRDKRLASATYTITCFLSPMIPRAWLAHRRRIGFHLPYKSPPLSDYTSWFSSTVPMMPCEQQRGKAVSISHAQVPFSKEGTPFCFSYTLTYCALSSAMIQLMSHIMLVPRPAVSARLVLR